MIRACLLLVLVTGSFAGYINDPYGYRHGVGYSGLMGYRYAPTSYAVADPAVARSYSTSYHGVPAVAAYGTPVAKVSTYASAPVAAIGTYAAAPVTAFANYGPAPVAKIATYATGYLNNAYGYHHGLGYSGLRGYRYAPATYAVAAPAVARSYSTSYHGVPAIAAYGAPVAKVAAYATAPVPRVPIHAGYLNNAYGYHHGLGYSGLMGYRYAPATYAVAAPAVARSYSTSYHGVPAVAAYGAPVAKVAAYATAPVARVATYATTPIARVPIHAGYLNNAYGYHHGLGYTNLMGYRYAPARYAVAAPAVARSYSTSYHGAPAVAAFGFPVAKETAYATAPVARVATYATTPVARVPIHAGYLNNAYGYHHGLGYTNLMGYRYAPASYAVASPAVSRSYSTSYHGVPAVAAYGAPFAKVAAYATAPVARVTTYATGPVARVPIHAGYLNNAYGYHHGLGYTNLMGYRYAPARYAVPAPAVGHSYATSYHGVPAVAAYGAPVAKVAAFATAPVAKVATYATTSVARVPIHAGYLNNAYGYHHGVGYTGLMGYRYAPASYALAAPAVARSYSTSYHGVPAVAAYGAPVAKVAAYATAPVASVSTYATAPVARVPVHSGYLNNAYGYHHGLGYTGLMGYRYAPASYAVAAPAVARSYSTSYHGVPAVAAYGAPFAKVAAFATAPVAKVATYATAPVARVPIHAGFLNNAYGYHHGLGYSGLMGYRYAPASYAVAAPAISRSYSTSYHGVPAVAAYGAPVAKVAAFATAPVARVATYATAPVARVPIHAGYLNNAYGYHHGLGYSGLMGYRYAPASYAVAAPAIARSYSTSYHGVPAVAAYGAPVAKVAAYANAPVASVATYATAPVARVPIHSGYLNNAYGYHHGLGYTGLMGYRYAPASYAVAAPTVARSFATAYHGVPALSAYAAPVAKVATFAATPAARFATYAAAPVARLATYATSPVAGVATYHSAYNAAPLVSKVHAYHASPAVSAVAHGPAYGYGYGVGHYGYGHGLAGYGLNYGYGLGSYGDYTALLHKKK